MFLERVFNNQFKIIYESLEDCFKNSKFDKYRIFYKSKDDDECKHSYIIFTLDVNSQLMDSCANFETTYIIYLVIVSNYKNANNNIEISDLIIKHLNCNLEEKINSYSVTDSIVHETCSQAITNIRIELNSKFLEIKCH